MWSPLELALIGWGAMAVLMLVFYFVQRVTQDADIVDAGWAFGVGSLAVFYALAGTGDPARRLLLGLLGGIWGLRLASYLFLNRVLKEAEDGRYKMLRERWSPHTQRYFLVFFQAQALWAVLFAIPFLPVAFHDANFPSLWDVLGIGIWIVAVLGETLADRQLAAFRARTENRGKTCREGLWKYSRHPNYFFEWIHWFAYVFLALGSSWFWVAWTGPVVSLFFLYKFTGIPYTEQQALASRGEDYRRYQETTSAFIPWFPRKRA